jgi:hypothetical protein
MAESCKLCAEQIPIARYFDGRLMHFDGLMTWTTCSAMSEERTMETATLRQQLEAMRFYGDYGSLESLPSDYVYKLMGFIVARESALTAAVVEQAVAVEGLDGTCTCDRKAHAYWCGLAVREQIRALATRADWDALAEHDAAVQLTERSLMSCGHPKACWVSNPNNGGTDDLVGQNGFCVICRGLIQHDARLLAPFEAMLRVCRNHPRNRENWNAADEIYDGVADDLEAAIKAAKEEK